MQNGPGSDLERRHLAMSRDWLPGPDQRAAHGAGRAGRDVIVTVRRCPIALIEDVLDIELRLPRLVDFRKHARVDAYEAWQSHAVVGRRKRIRKIDDAD